MRHALAVLEANARAQILNVAGGSVCFFPPLFFVFFFYNYTLALALGVVVYGWLSFDFHFWFVFLFVCCLFGCVIVCFVLFVELVCLLICLGRLLMLHKKDFMVVWLFGSRLIIYLGVIVVSCDLLALCTLWGVYVQHLVFFFNEYLGWFRWDHRNFWVWKRGGGCDPVWRKLLTLMVHFCPLLGTYTSYERW